MILQNLRHFVEYLIFRSVVCILQSLSFRQSVWICEQFAYAVTNIFPARLSRYKVAADNLKHSFPGITSEQIHQTIYQMWLHLFRMICEVAQSGRKLALENCREVIIFKDRIMLLKAMSVGRPVIILSGHYGNWEMAINTFGIFGLHMGVVARALDNPGMHKWFKNYREQTGHQTVLKKGGYDEIVELMDKKGYIAMLCDQDAGTKGLFVNFLGRPASSFKSIALLALEFKACLSMGYARRLPDDFVNSRWARYEIGCEGIIDSQNLQTRDDVREITEKYTQLLEKMILEEPSQYFWIHKRWKSEPRKKAVALSSAEAA